MAQRASPLPRQAKTPAATVPSRDSGRKGRSGGHLAELGSILNQSSTVQRQRNWTAEFNQADPSPADVRGSVAQRWLDPDKLKGRTQDKRIADLARLALDYNANRKGKTRTDRINELNGLQVATMKWLNDFEAPDQNVSDAALWVKDLMNDIQREHVELITASVDKGDADPPVANFSTLSQKDQAVVRSIWQQLVGGTGNIRITETETYTNTDTNQPDSRQHLGFRYEALAQFARLLETQTGRSLVGQVNADTKGAKLVTIKPGFAAPSQGAPGSEFAAGPVDLTGGDKLTPVDINQMFKGQQNAKRKRDNYRRQFVDVDLAKFVDPKARAAEIYKARADHPKSAGLRIGGKYYKFGKGSAVDVTITRDVRDAEDHHMSRFVDEKLNEIPIPNFITLGHELGHATHMQAGVALGDQTTSGELLPQVAPAATTDDWSNLEEYANINTVENALRAEYGLKARYGHINQPTVQKVRLYAMTNQFYVLCDRQPVPFRAAVNAPLGQAIQLLGNLEIAPGRTALKLAATTFASQMDAAFPGFTQNEKNNVRSELTQFKTKVDSAKPAVLDEALAHINQADHLVTQANTRVQQAQQQQQQQGAQQQGGGGLFSPLWRAIGY